jgi:hypothetical protein
MLARLEKLEGMMALILKRLRQGTRDDSDK